MSESRRSFIFQHFVNLDKSIWLGKYLCTTSVVPFLSDQVSPVCTLVTTGWVFSLPLVHVRAGAHNKSPDSKEDTKKAGAQTGPMIHVIRTNLYTTTFYFMASTLHPISWSAPPPHTHTQHKTHSLYQLFMHWMEYSCYKALTSVYGAGTRVLGTVDRWGFNCGVECGPSSKSCPFIKAKDEDG